MTTTTSKPYDAKASADALARKAEAMKEARAKKVAAQAARMAEERAARAAAPQAPAVKKWW